MTVNPSINEDPVIPEKHGYRQNCAALDRHLQEPLRRLRRRQFLRGSDSSSGLQCLVEVPEIVNRRHRVIR